jgi:hypothetical protein
MDPAQVVHLQMTGFVSVAQAALKSMQGDPKWV